MTDTKPTKAIVAFVITFLATVLATIKDRTDLGTMTAVDWLIVVVSALSVSSGVYVTQNKPRA